MSVTSPITRFLTGTYAVSRPAGGSYVNGVWTPGTPTTFNVAASVQPFRGKTLEILPEAEQGKEIREFYTTTELRIRDDVTIASENWRVVRVEAWPRHWRAYVAREDTP